MVTLPNQGDDPWDVALNAALTDLQAQITASVASQSPAVRTVTVDATFDDDDDVILVNSTNPIDISLHDATTAKRKWYSVKNIGTGAVTVFPPGGQTIDGAAQYGPMTQHQLIDFLPDGTVTWRAF